MTLLVNVSQNPIFVRMQPRPPGLPLAQFVRRGSQFDENRLLSPGVRHVRGKLCAWLVLERAQAVPKVGIVLDHVPRKDIRLQRYIKHRKQILQVRVVECEHVAFFVFPVEPAALVDLVNFACRPRQIAQEADMRHRRAQMNLAIL